MATHSSMLAWKILWTKGLVGYSPWGRKELDTTEQLRCLSFFNIIKPINQAYVYLTGPLPGLTKEGIPWLACPYLWQSSQHLPLNLALSVSIVKFLCSFLKQFLLTFVRPHISFFSVPFQSTEVPFFPLLWSLMKTPASEHPFQSLFTLLHFLLITHYYLIFIIIL